MPEFDFKPAYRAMGWGDGIAWRVTGYQTFQDENWDWTGIESVERNTVVAHMIGDDRDFTFDVDDLTPLKDDEFCSECGQVGCGHGNI